MLWECFRIIQDQTLNTAKSEQKKSRQMSFKTLKQY